MLKMLFRVSALIFCTLISLSSFADERILFVGDSHIPGPFGKTLDQLMRVNQNNRVSTFGVCGSTALYFFKGTPTKCGYFSDSENGYVVDTLVGPSPLIGATLANFKPTLTIVELGSNYTTGWTNEAMKTDMLNLANSIHDSGSRCVWVSMPDTRMYHAIENAIVANTLAAVGGLCEVIDSTKLTVYPSTGGDGLHYEFKDGAPVAIAWAKQVYTQIFGSTIFGAE